MKEQISAKIGKFVEDITTLDVLTLSGKVTMTPDAAPSDKDPAEAKEVKWDAYFKSIVDQLKTPSEDTQLEVVAYTHTEIDADSVNYYRDADSTDALRDLHLRTVESATKARLEALAAFARVFNFALLSDL